MFFNDSQPNGLVNNCLLVALYVSQDNEGNIHNTFMVRIYHAAID